MKRDFHFHCTSLYIIDSFYSGQVFKDCFIVKNMHVKIEKTCDHILLAIVSSSRK